MLRTLFLLGNMPEHITSQSSGRIIAIRPKVFATLQLHSALHTNIAISFEDNDAARQQSIAELFINGQYDLVGTKRRFASLFEGEVRE